MIRDYGYFSVFSVRISDLLERLLEHILIVGFAMLLGCLVAIPLGIFLSRTSIKWVHSIVFTVTNIFQTIPSLALLAMFIPLLGIGIVPAIAALFLYSLLPILRNTFAGFESIDPGVIESAKGMGYSSVQRLFQVELPLVIPYVMSGIRLTTVYIISWAVLAALIGAGGLGQLILSGLGVNDKPLILSASIFAMILALAVDYVLGWVEKLLTKRTHSEKKQI